MKIVDLMSWAINIRQICLMVNVEAVLFFN